MHVSASAPIWDSRHQARARHLRRADDLGLGNKLDFSFSGPRGTRLARLVQDRHIEIGAIHT